MSKGFETVDNLCWKLSLCEHGVREELVMNSRHCYGSLKILLKPEIVHNSLEKEQNESKVEQVSSCEIWYFWSHHVRSTFAEEIE